jgi:DNA uptake protein ComE-like DNA-binding protein
VAQTLIVAVWIGISYIPTRRESMKLYRGFAVALMLALSVTVCQAESKTAPASAAKQAVAVAPVDLNTASQVDLEKLPGIGPAMAKKIIAGRPYTSAGDLAKSGIPPKTIEKITPLVTVSAAPAMKPAMPKVTTPAAKTQKQLPTADTAKAVTLDLNNASQAELEKLPGIGPVSAKKIIANRPYTAVSDLAKTGVPAKTIEKITPMVTVSAIPATVKSTAPKAPVPPIAPVATPTATTPKKSPTTEATKTVTPPPADTGMVWVNTESKIYHKSGSQWYGKTKAGSYMSEADALKAGYRAAK